MSQFDRPGTTVQDRDRRRNESPRPRLGDRIARTFGGFDRTRQELPEWESAEDLGYPEPDESTEVWDSVDTRFPLTRNGYEPTVVDEHIGSLERELEELRARNAGAVSAEIEKVGEQTSAILLLAHDKAKDITRTAQEQADRCVADAASNAVALTEAAKQKLRKLDAETESIWQERARLLEDARQVARSLSALIDAAATRFPAGSERGTIAVAAPVPTAIQADSPAQGDAHAHLGEPSSPNEGGHNHHGW